MKLTRMQLKKIIKEELAHIVLDDVHEVPDNLEFLDSYEAYGLGHNAGTEHASQGDNDGRMTKKHLYMIMKYATILHDMIGDDEDLPEWLQSKVTRAAEKLSSAFEHLDSNTNQPESLGHM